MKRKFLLIVLTLASVLCMAFALAACGGNSGGEAGNGSHTQQGGTQGNEPDPVKEFTVTFDANGGAFEGGAKTYSQTVQEGSKLTAPVSPSRSNYTFAGWAKRKSGSEMWKFDEDAVSGDTTLFAQWAQESAIILSVEGASIEDREIFMLVDHTTSEISLSSKVVCSDDSIWRLYSDPEGQREIPTKMVTNLKNGNNSYYIVVNSQNQAQVNVYELTVHRSYLVSVSYFNGESLLKTAETYTGDSFTADFTPEITGYTFHGWKDWNGSEFTTDVLWSSLALFADKTANTYTATLDVSGGDSLAESEKSVVYDSEYSFPVPKRTGYSFTGWYAGSTQLTDARGKGLTAWNYTRTQNLTAHWSANQYSVTLKQNDKDAGAVSGGGEHDYDSQVTITATTNRGYNFLGWYDKEDKLVSEQAKYTFKMGFAVSYTAKWDYYTVTATRNDTSAGFLSKNYTDEKVSVGTEVTLTATTYKGYTFIGWFKGEQQVSAELSFQFTMGKENVSYEARWCKVTLTVNDPSAGSVTPLNDTYKAGDKVTLTATTNMGYIFIGWYKGENLVEDSETYQLTMGKENVEYEARWRVTSEMQDFKFDSTPTTCTITGVKNSDVTELVIPKFVTSIAEGAFKGCGSLQSITLPFVGGSRKTTQDSYQYPFGYIFGTSSFSGASAVYQRYVENIDSHPIKTTITCYYIPDSLNSITITSGEILPYAFDNCSGLSEITILDSVTEIGSEAFAGCSGLTEITISNSVTSIGNYAFTDTAYYNDGSKWIGEALYIGNHLIKARDTISGSYSIRGGTKTIASGAFYQCRGLTEITIPDSVTGIGDRAFYQCSGLTEITIPNSVTEIEWCAFDGCSRLKEVHFEHPNEWKVSGNYDMSDATAVTGLEDPETAARYLTDTYRNYYWKREG